MARWNRSCERLALPTFDEAAMVACLKKLVEVDADWVPPPPPPSRTKWTRLVHPFVLIGHVSSLGQVPDRDGFSLYIRPTALGTDNVLGVHPSERAVSPPPAARRPPPPNLLRRVGAGAQLFFIITCPVGPYFKKGFAPVKILAETHYKRAWPGGMGGHKVGGNYAPGMLPQRAAQEAGYAQVLWLFGEQDIVTEVGSMNVFVHWVTPEGREQLITAPLDGTILPGVTRDSILELVREWGDCEVARRPRAPLPPRPLRPRAQRRSEPRGNAPPRSWRACTRCRRLRAPRRRAGSSRRSAPAPRLSSPRSSSSGPTPPPRDSTISAPPQRDPPQDGVSAAAAAPWREHASLAHGPCAARAQLSGE